MRPKPQNIRPLTTAQELGADSPSTKNSRGTYEMNDVVERISLEKVSLEERRREAKEPLYLVRYE